RVRSPSSRRWIGPKKRSRIGPRYPSSEALFSRSSLGSPYRAAFRSATPSFKTHSWPKLGPRRINNLAPTKGHSLSDVFRWALSDEGEIFLHCEKNLFLQFFPVALFIARDLLHGESLFLRFECDVLFEGHGEGKTRHKRSFYGGRVNIVVCG